VAEVAPKLTALTPTNPVPVIVTAVPPLFGPAAGLTLVTVGEPTYVNWSAAVGEETPLGVVTVISAVPVPAGAVAVIEVALLTVNVVAAVPPNLTEVAPVKAPPVRLTDVPPPRGPAAGLTLEIVGVATT
jgi:hypothetical protein